RRARLRRYIGGRKRVVHGWADAGTGHRRRRRAEPGGGGRWRGSRLRRPTHGRSGWGHWWRRAGQAAVPVSVAVSVAVAIGGGNHQDAMALGTFHLAAHGVCGGTQQ